MAQANTGMSSLAGNASGSAYNDPAHPGAQLYGLDPSLYGGSPSQIAAALGLSPSDPMYQNIMAGQYSVTGNGLEVYNNDATTQAALANQKDLNNQGGGFGSMLGEMLPYILAVAGVPALSMLAPLAAGAGAAGVSGGAGAAGGGDALTGALTDGFNSGTAAGLAGGTQVAGDATGIGSVGAGADGAGMDALIGGGADAGIAAPGGGISGFGGLAGVGAGVDAPIGGGATAGIAAPGGGVAAAGGAAATALSKVLSGTANAADWAQLAGQILPGIAGAIGSNQQANALSGLADKYWNAGQPSRSRYEASMSPGFDPMSIPGYSGAVSNASDAAMHSLSTQGNPYGNPSGLIAANKQIINGTELPAIQQYQANNAATGGYASLNGAYNQTAQQAIGSQSGVLNSLGSAAGNALNPTTNTGTIADLLKGLAKSNVFGSSPT